MSSQYVAAVPSEDLVRPEIQAYFQNFYQISDTPEAHQEYSEQFTDNARLIMASNEANGREGVSFGPSNTMEMLILCNAAILKMRTGMWEKVAKRSHKPAQIYAFEKGSDDVMLYGTVDYELKDGKKTAITWSARSHFVEEGGKLKMDFYQVYLVSLLYLGYPAGSN